MKRIFSGAKSPKINLAEKFSMSEPIPQSIETSDNVLTSPIDDEKVSPELVPIMTLLSAHLHRRYHEGVLLVLEDLKNDGTTGKRQWKEMYAVLIGTQLALWDANDLNGEDETSLKNSASKPTYINFTDANIQSIETVNGVTAENDKKLENILVVSTTLKNRYFLQFSNKESLNQWNAAIRLSLYECTSLQEAYTGAFISSRGSRLSDIGVLLASTKFNYEDWVSVRFGVGMPWKRCYAVITQKSGKKKDTIGEINFYETDKKIKKQHSMTTVSHARAVYAVYPSSPKLIDNSTMIKLEGTVKFKDEENSQETNLFIMPERHDAVPCYDTIIRFILPVMNAFRLYGRPKKLIANKDDPMSLLFALPTLPHISYLQVDDLLPLTSSSSCSYWSSLEWKEKIRDILQTKLTKGYSGCGSSSSLKDILASPLLESSELFQTSGNILSPLLRSTSGGVGILSPRLGANNGSKVFQRNTSGLKSTSTLNSSVSRSPESPLDLDATPTLPNVPLNINQQNMNNNNPNEISPPKQRNKQIQGQNYSPSNMNGNTSPYNQRGPMNTDINMNNPRYNGSPKKNIPSNSSGLNRPAMMNPSSGPIPAVNMPPVNGDKWTSNNHNNNDGRKPAREPQGRPSGEPHNGALLDQSNRLNEEQPYNERYVNFLNPNARRDKDPSPRKTKPDALNLKSSNFDKFSNQDNVSDGPSPGKSTHSRAESSFSFLIDAYRELDDNNKSEPNGTKGLDISMKQLNLSNDTDNSSEHDVFDPDFVEQNQMLELENTYGSMTSQTRKSNKARTNNSPRKDQNDKVRQEKEVSNVRLPKNDYETSNPQAHLNAPHSTQNGRSLSPHGSTFGKKAPPPPPIFNQQPSGQPHKQQSQEDQSGQQPCPQQGQQPHPQQQGPQHNHPNQQPQGQNIYRPPPQQMHSPNMNNNTTPTNNNFSIVNPYAKGPMGSSPQSQHMPIPQNRSGKGNMPQAPMGYPNSQQRNNTPPFKQSPVFNGNSPQFTNNLHQRPYPQQQQQQKQPNPHHRLPPQQQQPIQMNNTMNRAIPPGQGQGKPQGQYPPRAPYGNNNNNNNYTQNQSPPPNRPFPGTVPRGNNNNMNNMPTQQGNPQMYHQQQRGPYNNNPNHPNGRPIPQNNNAFQQQPFRPQPTQMSGSPQQRGFNRPKPGGFSQFMPPSSSTKSGTNPYA
ncbi:CCR4-NOT transcriptional complex subunit Caf120p [Monosporozyma unispora]